MAEVKSARCAIIAIVILQSLSLPVVEAAVNSSLPVGDAKGMHATKFNFAFFAGVTLFSSCFKGELFF